MTITQEDRALLNTNFGEDIEKIAEQHASAISEAYQYGFSKIAKEMADEKDKEDKEEKKEHKEEKMDEESEKAAAELGAFIERGFFDGLRKLGAERHGNEFHYIEPFIQNKIAGAKTDAAIQATKNFVGKFHPKHIAEDVVSAATGKNVAYGGGKGLKHHFVENVHSAPMTGKERALTGLRAAGLATPYAALGGGAIYGGAKLVGGSDKGE